MQFAKPGVYKTQLGLKAVVAKIVNYSTEGVPPMWLLRGAVEIQGVLYMANWNLHGKSMSGDTKFDLVST